MAIAFTINFTIGVCGELVALKTGAYDVIVANKTERRYLIDKKVYELRQDIEKWTLEDARIAERKKHIIG